MKPFNKFNNLHSSDEAAIDGAARAFREVQGETEPELEQAKKETRPEPKPEAKPVPSSDPVTNQARGVINDGYNRLRDEGWKEEDIQHYRDSCGHMAVPDYVRKKNPAKYPPRGYSC